MTNSIITQSGSYIPTCKVLNKDFLGNEFYGPDGVRLEKANTDIVATLEEITCIKERRYIADGLNTSDMAFEAAKQALEGVDMESLDYIIVGQNLGEVLPHSTRAEMVPTIAARVKHKLRIENPYTVAFDIPFGCPGWLQGVQMADYYIKSGDARKVLVIGAETLSRVSDPHDIDGMIYADGAGAVLMEPTKDKTAGILSHVTRSDTYKHVNLLRIGKSYNPNHKGDDLYLKMDGHEIYKYAVRTVPQVVKESLDKAGINLTDVKKAFVHQANEKLDEAILQRLFKLYNIEQIPEHIMPMTISWLGNTSVATLPTMFDLVLRGKLGNHSLRAGDIIVFASVGAGMNSNAMVYRMPENNA